MQSRRCSRSVLAALILACLSPCVVSASADSASLDATSGRAASHALQRYFTTLVADLPASQQSEEQYVASVQAACPNVLAPLNALPASSVNMGTATALGEELGLDVSLASFVPDRTPLATLTSALSKLRWSSAQRKLKVKRALAAQHELFSLKQSDLCADAHEIAASNFQTTPPPTIELLAAFGRVDEAAKRSTLAKVPGSLRPTSANKRLARTISSLAAQWNSRWSAQDEAEAKVLESALGLPG